jgi:hypothetical protein
MIDSLKGRSQRPALSLLGGLGTIAVALLWMKLFPALRKVERL